MTYSKKNYLNEIISMKKYQFNKLIRSHLPERMKEEGVELYGRHLSKDEFAQELKNKLIEEALEVKDTDSRDNLVRELADIMEVVEAILLANGITSEEVERERVVKRKINGHFLPANFITYIEVSTDNQKVINYLENRNRPYELI